MSIIRTSGNIFDNDCALINPINRVGVMGAGLALQFKKRFPIMYKDYVNRCTAKVVNLPYLYITHHGFEIINFPTKNHWEGKASITLINNGLCYLKNHLCQQYSISHIAMPALGCGLGGLDWDEVSKRIHHYFDNSHVLVFLYEPF